MKLHKSSTSNDDPWEMVWGQPYIDADRLCRAIEHELREQPKPDFRTRLLIRDAAAALESYWGQTKFEEWLQRSPAKIQIQDFRQESLGEPGFKTIRRRLVTSLKKDQLEQVFEILSEKIQHPLEVYIAGSIPTLMEGLTVRPTDDIDFVDEVPSEIRDQRAAIDTIEAKYGLTLGHVQSHYLPANWKERSHSLGNFGRLRVYLVDSYDVFVSKLSSKQEKHKDDLRVLASKLDKSKARQRLLTDGQAFLESEFDRPTIEDNWRFIYREPLFPEE